MVQFLSTDARLNNFRMDINNFPSFLENLAKNYARKKLEKLLKEKIEKELPGLIAKELNDLSAPHAWTVGGRTMTLTVRPEALSFDDQGFSAALAVNVELPPDPNQPQAPGSLVTPSGLPTFGTAPGFYASVSDDLVNRTLFACWRAGVLNFELDQQKLASLGGALPFQLNAALLSTFLPQLGGIFPPNAPAILRIKPSLPPIFGPEPNGQGFEVAGGEIAMEMLIDDGVKPTSILTAVFHAKLQATVAYANNNTLTLTVGQNPLLFVDVVAEPFVDFNDWDVENFLALLASPLMQYGINSIGAIPLPSIPIQGIQPTNVSIYPDGPAGDYVTVSGDL